MPDPDHINLLLTKLEELLKRQESFTRDISELRSEINQLQAVYQPSGTIDTQPLVKHFETPASERIVPNEKEGIAIYKNHKSGQRRVQAIRPTKKPPALHIDLEKFIGGNLISKIGIAITVIGVGIGAKYSIEHQLISPLARILLEYLVAAALLFIGLKLKKKYPAYSAVLVSGAMAIAYFMTYTAYSFYNLMPQAIAFLLMLLLTAFTVAAAIKYNQQVIAHIGLVGAYAVPFLLSEGSGRVAILFSYMAIINIGILIISFKKYWKPLYYSSVLLTWLIYASWYINQDRAQDHFTLGLIFAFLFFLIFYASFLAYKLLRHEQFKIGDILLLLGNSFVFYAFGYSILSGNLTGNQWLGVFTLVTALIHFLVSTIIYRQKLDDRNLFYLVLGLTLIFITIAIPVQLHGNWVTLLWAGEGALLFWIGKSKKVLFYENLSYPLMLLSFFSIAQDWNYREGGEGLNFKTIAFLNVSFLSSLLFIAFFSLIDYTKQGLSPQQTKKGQGLRKIMSFVIPAILIWSIYNAIRIEIGIYWDRLYAAANANGVPAMDSFGMSYFQVMKSISTIDYSLLFLTLLSLVNIKSIRSNLLAQINMVFNIIGVAVFLFQGLLMLSSLRDIYISQLLHLTAGRYYFTRYFSFLFLGILLYAIYRYIKDGMLQKNYTNSFDILLHISILWTASSELINWMDIVNAGESYKLGLTILWGVYALLCISIGLWKKKKHLRLGAIVLSGITLLKLFAYDLTSMDTISKIIVFVSLGVILLLISFLYNKYNHILS